MRCFWEFLRQGLRDESGQSLVLGTVCIFTLLAFAGLAIDVGQLRYQKRQMQAAADAAALAGALELSTCGGTPDCAAMTAAAQSAVAENGLTVATPLTQCTGAPSATGLTLWVNNGPCRLGSTSADPNYGNTQYVEAVLSSPVNTFFASVAGFKSMTVTVRAVATGAPADYCLVVSANNTSSSAPTGMTLNSSGGIIDATNCSVYDDSGGPNALESNPGATVDSTKFMVHGAWSPDNGGTFSSTPSTGAPPLPDPLAYLTANNDAPTPGSCTSQSSTPGNGATLTPATFCSGFNLNSGVAVSMSPGTYIIEGGVNIGSGATLSGSGVTLYFTGSGQLQANSNSTVSLSAPTSGSLAGILIWQASSDSNAMIIDSGASSKFDGAIYAPGAQLTLNAAGNTAACTLVDVGSVMLDASANFTINMSSSDCSAYANSQAFSSGSAALVE